VYNRATYLERSILTALNQTLTDFEIVVIDDGSIDKSPAIVRRLAKRDPRLLLIRHRKNLGTHAARQTGVFAAHGTYILSLDPDDLLLPRIAELAVRAALVNKVDIVEFQAIECPNDTSPCELFTFLPPRVRFGTGSLLRMLFIRRRLGWNIWKRLIRKDVYVSALNLFASSTNATRIVYGEDKLHIGLIFLLANGFCYIEEPGYVYYRFLPENSESGKQQTPSMCIDQLRYVEKILMELYANVSNLSYPMDLSIPSGLQRKLPHRRKRGSNMNESLILTNSTV
jgi:glycosyltransferase involved in cell wall biosynthesis